jgi:cytochrome b subunit of formate dehydrogenase
MMDKDKYHKGDTVSFEGKEYICLGNEDDICRKKVFNQRLMIMFWVSFVAMVLVAVFGLVILIEDSIGEVLLFYAFAQFITVIVNAYDTWRCYKMNIKLD